MKEVKYPCVLKLPVVLEEERQAAESEDQSMTDSSTPVAAAASSTSPSHKKLFHTYVLYSVIVHSGTSSQHGHYYAISRQSDDDAMAQLRPLARGLSLAEAAREAEGGDVSPQLEQAAQGGRWYQFNDSTVTPSSFDALEQLTSAMPSDVAYLLFYRSIDSLLQANSNSINGSSSAATAAPEIDPRVLAMVHSDNAAHEEQSRQSQKVSPQHTHLERRNTHTSWRQRNPSRSRAFLFWAACFVSISDSQAALAFAQHLLKKPKNNGNNRDDPLPDIDPDMC